MTPPLRRQARNPAETGPRRTRSPAPTPLVTARATAPDVPVNTAILSKSEQGGTEEPARPITREKAQNKPEPEQQNKEVKLSIGGGNSFTLTLPGQKPATKAATSPKEEPVTPKSPDEACPSKAGRDQRACVTPGAPTTK